MTLNAKINIQHSFVNERNYSKTLEDGDFKEFFTDEGCYLDNLAKVLNNKGKSGDTFKVVYTVYVEAL